MGHRLSNREVADILLQIADMLEIKGEVVYKALAYRRAAQSIVDLGRDVNEVWAEGGLRQIPGVGEALSRKLDELLRTGHLQYYEELQEEVPPGVVSLLAIPDVGPKTARLLWERLGAMSIAEVEEAARAGKLRELPGLGARSEQRILEGIRALNRRSRRIPLGIAWPVAMELLEQLRNLPGVEEASAAGSLRRMCATIGDLDLLAAAKDGEAITRAFTRLPQVSEVVMQGPTKATVILENGVQADLRVLPRERWGSLLQYFTGSKDHNVALRALAQSKGLSLSEYGYKRGKEEILCPEEAQVYTTLGLPWVPPELREDRGEIQAAQEGHLPGLVELKHIRGDLHVHSDWSDGVASIEELASEARDLGYEYLVVSDHTQSLAVASGLSAKRFEEQRRLIDRLNARSRGARILQGCELEIHADGSLDFPDDVLARFDLVVASVHTGLRQSREQVTGRVMGALRNPHVDVIGHLTGRLLGQREPSAVDVEAVLQEAARTGTAIEVNGIPDRLDLDDVHIKRAMELGVLIAVVSDAHSASALRAMYYGVATARRGWATPKAVLNTRSFDQLQKWLARRG
ncbi:MAG: DNA polymerase/3'-5' exonuclease PolX [Anaerolineae bacterium]|nr:DNA polymerase/3'-5' exonuclease PolX [Anaerolineae bacterium]